MRVLSVLTLAALILAGSGVALQRGTPSVPASALSSLATADARLRLALAGAAKAEEPTSDPQAQYARLIAADAALDDMAASPARDRDDLDRKAAALLFVGGYEVQDDWRLARSIARDTLRLDVAREGP